VEDKEKQKPFDYKLFLEKWLELARLNKNGPDYRPCDFFHYEKQVKELHEK